MKFQINSVRQIKRLILIAFIGITLFSVLLVYLLQESISEVLTKERWCVLKIEFNNKILEPRTTSGGYPLSINNCSETIKFNREGKISLPGFNSAAVNGKWGIYDERIRIFETDNFASIYEGDYNWEHNNGELKMYDHKTVFILRSNKLKLILNYYP